MSSDTVIRIFSGVIRHLLLLSLVFALSIECAHSQYNEPESFEVFSSRYASVGFLQRDFSPRATNPLGDSLGIHYDRIMPVAGLRQGPVEFMLGYVRYTFLGEKRDAVFLGATYVQDVMLAGNRTNAFTVPVTIAIDYTKSETSGPQRETFNIVSIGGGAGVKYRHTSPSMDAVVSGVFTLLFSSDGFGTGTGLSTATIAESVLLFKRIPIFEGIAVGYRLRYQTWAMSDERFDYRSLSHGPFLGVLF